MTALETATAKSSKTRPTSAGDDTVFTPRPPTTLAETGLDPALVESLILKHLFGCGSATGSMIAEAICLPAEIVATFLVPLKQQQIVVYSGTAEIDDFTYTLTDAGRERARRYMAESLYVGPAPVPIEAYIRSVEAQTIRHMQPKEDDLRRAFEDLLIDREMLHQLGPAINSGRGLFLYGAPGNGKTSIAERITRCFGDEIYIPHCLVCDGMIIKLFDAAWHEVVHRPRDSIFKKDRLDDRWIRIRRPTLVVGGELTMDTLEVRYNAASRTCEAPVQLKSNCGTLVIDDFGRQRMKPIELLNRWIVPLERRHDFLAMPNGKKLRVPFDQLIIFSTNLEPKDLCDEAFLRRIPYKINVGDPDEAAFRKLFELVGPSLGFTFDDEAGKAVDYLVAEHYRKPRRPFRCCQPRDLLLQVRNRCAYLGQPTVLTPALLDHAVEAYFTVL
jgi:predicted ATPase with chaperone activity